VDATPPQCSSYDRTQPSTVLSSGGPQKTCFRVQTATLCSYEGSRRRDPRSRPGAHSPRTSFMSCATKQWQLSLKKSYMRRRYTADARSRAASQAAAVRDSGTGPPRLTVSAAARAGSRRKYLGTAVHAVSGTAHGYEYCSAESQHSWPACYRPSAPASAVICQMRLQNVAEHRSQRPYGSSRRCPSDCEPMLKEAGAAAFALQHTLQHSLAGSWFCTSCAALCAPRGESERQVADRYVVGPREVVDGAVRGADAHVPDEGQQPGDDGDRRPDDAVGVQVLRRGIAMCRRHSPHTRSSTELYVGLLPRCQMRLSGTGGGKVNAKHSRDERGVAARSPHVCPVASAVGTLITQVHDLKSTLAGCQSA